MKKDKKIWLITGISSGLGKALAEKVIEKGDFVIGTFRNENQIEQFNKLYQNKAIGINLDITDSIQISKTFEFVESSFGKLDILVNNAGFGFAGSIEETNKEESRAVFDANFFGVFELTKAFLPIFRKQHSGHIFQISSHGGVKAFAGFGIYNASKFALEGLSEALAQEVAPLGIQVTLVEPGPFRTNFAGKNFMLAKNVIEDYDQTSGVFRKKIKMIDGNQEGDPEKAAKSIVEFAYSENTSLRLPLGKIAVNSIQDKIDCLQNDLDLNKELAQSAVY